MSGPSFSVVIAAYNAAGTLGRALRSVLEQSHAAREIIVVDDGSTDETAAVAAAFAPAVKCLRQANGGVSAARNAGAAAATGDWLAFLDADDWYFPERLSRHASLIARDPNLDFLTGDYEYRREDGSLIGRSMPGHASGRAMLAKAAGSSEVIMESGELEEFVADHFGDTHTLSVPRRTFLELGGYPPGFRVCEDVHFLIRLCARSRRVGVVCEPLGVYLIHDHSATRADRLTSQYENVRTLNDLKRIASGFPDAIRRGCYRRIGQGRTNHAYALAKAGRKGAAFRAVLPSLVESPGWGSVRVLLSVLRG